jgi:hypothetical protein
MKNLYRGGMKLFNDKYAILKLRKDIKNGPIYGHEREIIYNLDKNNIIKNGKNITFHDDLGKVIYSGRDYIYIPFSIYVFIQDQLLGNRDIKNDSRNFDIYKTYPRNYIVGARDSYTEEERDKIINNLKNDYNGETPFINEIICFLEGYRSCILGTPSKEYDFKETYILNGKYTKVTKKNGTIIIYVHDSREKFVCNSKTGLIFEEAPLGEEYGKKIISLVKHLAIVEKC